MVLLAGLAIKKGSRLNCMFAAARKRHYIPRLSRFVELTDREHMAHPFGMRPTR